MKNYKWDVGDDSWKVWFETFRDGKKTGAGVLVKSYKYKGNAIRAGKKRFDRTITDRKGHTFSYNWTVSKTNPWAI